MTAPPPAYFVIGPPRSGTTLMLELLRRHPQVSAHGEDFHPFHHDLGLFRERAEPEEHYRLTTADASEALKARYQAAIAAAAGNGGRIFVLKISTLSQQVDYVRALCPEARFIQLVRDGRDAACSMEDLRRALEVEQGHRRELGPAPDPFGVWCVAQGFPKHVAAAASWYYHVTRSFLDLRFAGGDSFLRVRYEDLVTDARATMGRVLGFMGLPMVSGVERRLEEISDRAAAPGGLGFSTSQAVGARLKRHVRDLPADVLAVTGPLFETPMRLFGYEMDLEAADVERARRACVALGMDVEVWQGRVEREAGWFAEQLRVFAPERLLRQPDLPEPSSRPLLVDGAVVGTSARSIDGALRAGTSFVAKQARRFSFRDAQGRWPTVAAALDGRSTVALLQARFGLDAESVATLTRLHGLGFVGYG